MHSGIFDSASDREKQKKCTRIIGLIDFESLIFQNSISSLATQHLGPESKFNNYNFFKKLINSTSSLNVTFLMYYKNPRCRSQLNDFLKLLGNPKNIKTSVQQDDSLIEVMSSIRIDFQSSYNSYDGIAYLEFSQLHLKKTTAPRVDKYEYFDVNTDNLDYVKMKIGQLLCPIEISREVLETIFIPIQDTLTSQTPSSTASMRFLFSRFRYTFNWLYNNTEILEGIEKYFNDNFLLSNNHFQKIYACNFLYLASISKDSKGSFINISEDILSILFNYVSLSQIDFRSK